MTDTNEQGDIHLAPVNMGQVMSILANAVHSTIASNFVQPDDTDEEKVAATYICIAVFLQQFASGAKHMDKMIGMFEAVTESLRAQQAEETASK